LIHCYLKEKVKFPSSPGQIFDSRLEKGWYLDFRRRIIRALA